MSLLQEIEKHGLADCEFNRKNLLLEKLVQFDLECFYNNSFKNQERLLTSMFYENYRHYSEQELKTLYLIYLMMKLMRRFNHAH